MSSEKTVTCYYCGVVEPKPYNAPKIYACELCVRVGRSK